MYITSFAVKTIEGVKFAVMTNGGNIPTSLHCLRPDFAVSTRPRTKSHKKQALSENKWRKQAVLHASATVLQNMPF